MALLSAAALVGLAALAAAFWEVFATCAVLALGWFAAWKLWRALDRRWIWETECAGLEDGSGETAQSSSAARLC